MKSTFGILVFVLVSALCPAQSVEWGNQEKVRSRVKYTQVLGENSSGVFVARSRTSDFRDGLLIEKYKSNLAPEISKDLPQPDASWLERVIVVESGLLQFASAKNGTTGRYELLLTSFDNVLNPSATSAMLSADAEISGQDRKFTIRSSGDKKIFSVVYLSRGSDKSRSVLHVHGFDASLAQKFARKFPLDGSADDISLLGMECDNSGNVFVLLTIRKERSGKKNPSVNSFFLYAYYPRTDNMLEYDIGKDSLFVNEAALAVNNYSKTVNVAGFYSHRNDNRCNGHFMYRLDIAGNGMVVKQFTDFDDAFVGKVLGTVKNESNISLSDLRIRKLVPNSDGGCTVISEKYYETRQAYTSNVNGFPHTTYNTVYNYDEIVLLAYKGDGSLRFSDFVKKNHSSIGDGGYFSSFVTLLGNDKIALIYNLDVSTDSDILLFTINSKGVTDTRVLIKSMSYYVTIMPPESKQVTGNSAIITALKDRRFCLMRLTL